MVENEQSTEKKELTEIFCLRQNLEQKRYKKKNDENESGSSIR